MNTLQQIINQATAGLVEQRNNWRYKHSDAMTICIRALDKLPAARLLMDMFGYGLIQAKKILDMVKEQNMSYNDACNKYDLNN